MPIVDPFTRIEQYLDKHYIGTYKLDFARPHLVTSHPRARKLDREHADELAKSFKRGMRRDMAPPMSAILQSDNLSGSSSRKINPQTTRLLLISGQHSMKALEKLALNPRFKEHAWWNVRVYNQSSFAPIIWLVARLT
jgi:hypothetical protein